jgi:hypothetical protein
MHVKAAISAPCYSLIISWLPFAKQGLSMHPLDHVCTEQESEVQAEQVQAEAPTNLALDQGKP